MVVRKRGNRYVVLTKGGRRLGSHTTRAAALRQLRAVEAAKGRRSRPKRKR